MFVCHRPITLLLLRLFGSVASLAIHTPAPPLPSQIFPASTFPSNVPSFPASPGVPPSVPPFSSSTTESTTRARCPLTTSPSSVVVRFEDPVTVNCSVPETGFSLLGWEVSLEAPQPTMNRFLVWSVNSVTDWKINSTCYALSDHGGQCSIKLPIIVYKPPDNVSISLGNHCGPMLEAHRYTLHCEVQRVAPVGRLTVTFYKGQTALRQLRSNNTEKEPVTEVFTVDIVPSKEDDGVQYWCEATLELGPEGPRRPPVMMSQKLNASVHFGPQLICPGKLQVREGERLLCDVTGNPQPSVIWYRDGQAVALPTHSSRNHAGKYIVWTKGHLGQKNFTVEVEVLGSFGTSNSCNRCFLSAVLVIQMITWL
ncbi:uncharacterized protein LOC131467369 [Solea solea]|uniref:uncharacterized protein LOC131467369 n=1 Tax=Solea solea TaxID=90069 RepID=UPI00272DA8A3|nr:uncharacterized protein LOC131467369 [Solea solea]